MKRARGFTIIELLVAITIIAILVGITIFAFGSWRQRTAITEVKHELTTAASAIRAHRTFNNQNPATLGATAYKTNANVTMTYTRRVDGTFCLNGQSATVSSVQWHVETTDESPATGTCT